uniref:Uncharacterized protein n=1 Tax=viral metagenome TaxID=1070528 RepID=A0A6H1ZRD6_9ZZZZ
MKHNKYCIGDMVKDEDGNKGVVVIRWDDGDICWLENDAAHPNPVITLAAQDRKLHKVLSRGK